MIEDDDIRDPQAILEERIDDLFEATDYAAFLIMDEIVEVVRSKHEPRKE